MILAIILGGCIEQIDFEATDTIGILVVDGELSTEAVLNEVRLSRTDQLGKNVFPVESNATVSIFDQDGNQAFYQPNGDGRYLLFRDRWQPRVGNTYYIEIKTPDGNTYRSTEETIVAAPEIDSLNFEVAIENILVDEVRNLERRFVDLYVHTTMPSDQTAPYLKWDVEHVFSISEIKCGPLHGPKSCYVTRPINADQIFILDGNILSPGSDYRDKIAHQELDFAFGQVASFYVSQKSLSKTAYEYWNNLDQIVNEAGSIFGAPPAAVLGNISNVNDPSDEVLGFFSAVDEKNKVILITRGDLDQKFIVQPFCGIDGFPPTPLDPACCECLTMPGSSTMRPAYWPF